MSRQLRFGAALALVVVMAGCGTKKLVVDESFTQPEGTPSSQVELITFMDGANHKLRLNDAGRIGQVDLPRVAADTANVDTLALDAITRQPVITAIRANPAGTVRGIILNRSGAEGMEIFRSEPNGGVRKLFSYPLQASRRWIDGRAEVYEFADSDPGRPAGATYFARGLIGGDVGPNSPLSNASRPTNTPLGQVDYNAPRWGTPFGQSYTQAESTFFMAWVPVPGAARYLIHVFEYQTRIITLTERILSGSPSPLLLSGARDIFIGSVPASQNSYKLGAAGATVYTSRTPRLRVDYYVRIAAIDANGQMIAMSSGPSITSSVDLRRVFVSAVGAPTPDYFADFTSPEVANTVPPAFIMYSRGAYWVSPGHNPSPGTSPQP